ncbi:MAG: glycosyltransferase family 39 protein [Rubrobacteraceae bacterium]
MARTSATKPASAWPFVFAVFVASRLLFLGVGALAQVFLPGAEPAGSPLEPPGFLNYWAHWDGAWYAQIATEGYGAGAPASTAFFPLYPMLVRLGTALDGGPAFWGVLISLAATLFTLYFLYGIAEHLYDVPVARAATLTLAFFPTAFFLNAVYTEALFLAFTTGCAWAMYTRRDLLLAGLLGALAAATRNLGLLLLIPLFIEWYRNRREFGSGGLAGVLLVPTGLLAYGIFLAGRFGDPLVSARQQEEYWGRTFVSPVATLQGAWSSAVEGAGYWLQPAVLFLGSSSGPSLEASNTLNLVFFAVLLVLMCVGFVVLPPGLFLYTFAIMLLPLLTPSPLFPLMSLPRFMLGAFPLFLVLGYLLARSRPALVVWLVLSVGGGVALTALFTTWRWVA